ncbi:CDAN1-interacting nuclease 1-like isoform X1 [Branchiostoma floridae x Branchiostoma belcheri]
MKLAVYKEILKRLQGREREEFAVIAQHYRVSLHTLMSIYSQDYQKKMKKTHQRHHSLEAIDDYFQRYQARISPDTMGTVLLRIAKEVDLAPSLLAKIILERHLALQAAESEPPARSYVNQLLKDPCQIPDPVLANEVQQCILNDCVYGPVVDSIRHSVGFEYENKLKRILEDKGIAFIGEDVMRAKGYDKTPDFKLEVPIAVDGHVVNWVESKASFGDEFSHRTYLRDQFWSYWNRFGPGLVIYWFGFIDELDVNADKGIVLMDRFPDSFSTLQALSDRDR